MTVRVASTQPNLNSVFRVAALQTSPVLGDPDANFSLLREAHARLGDSVDLLVTSELFLCGYPPDDLLYRPDLIEACLSALDDLAALTVSGPAILVGTPLPTPPAASVDAEPRTLHNAAVLLAGGHLVGTYAKRRLPNYGPFDEARYFSPGADPAVFTVPAADSTTARFSVLICEDLWDPDLPIADLDAPGASAPDFVVCLNASPFHAAKQHLRQSITSSRARRLGLPLLYVAQAGAVDELVFDGGTHLMSADGTLLARSPAFSSDLLRVDFALSSLGDTAPSSPNEPAPWPSDLAEIYQALSVGLSSYVSANNIPIVFVGLSGGIDSALTATIAVDALGPDRVVGLTMPGPYSSPGSVSDSELLAASLGIDCLTLPISAAFTTLDDLFGAVFDAWDADPADVAHQNVQARLRGLSLMALANLRGGIVLATGNKSEMSVGYATLYGDMVGGYAVLKDVYKTDVYRLSLWRQAHTPHPSAPRAPFPQDTLTKPPSAELAPGQLDTDSLPPYEILDDILRRYVDSDAHPSAIAAALGLDPDLVWQVLDRVDRNEFKRRQAPIGIRISAKALGRDRRLPISARHVRPAVSGPASPVPADIDTTSTLEEAH